jgi:accessory gene regulator B
MSERIVDTLVDRRIVSFEDKELYRYGIKQGAFMGLSFLSSLIISVIFNLTFEYISFLAVFIPLRTYAGGYHSNSYIKCFVFSTVLIVLSLLAINMIAWTRTTCLVTAMSSGMIIYILSPMESENKPLTKEERKVYRKRVLILLVASALSVLVFWNVCQTISISFTVSIIAVSALMIVDLSLSD